MFYQTDLQFYFGIYHSSAFHTVAKTKNVFSLIIFLRNDTFNVKGWGSYDELGADIGNKNHIKSALATFIDRSG